MTATTFLGGRIALEAGDSRFVLKQFPENHFESVVCDPPYALVSIVKRFGKPGSAPVNNAGTQAGNGGDLYARAAAGFMGKEWDTGETAFASEFWAEVLRVLKPGGHVVAFSGTRTYHRMAVAIEDAGFEIRDQLAWAYGCLDERTMAVTSSGVMPYHKINKGDLVLAYSPSYMSYQWERVEEVFVYNVEDTVYRISTDCGDQIVSRNHRCIVERGGVEAFEFAEEAAREREIRVPILEDLQELLDAIPGAYERSSFAQSDVLAGVQVCDYRKGDLGGSVQEITSGPCGEVGGDLRGMRDDVLEEHKTSEKGCDSGLLARMQRRPTRGGMEQVRLVGTRELETGIGSGANREDDGADQPRMEGWRHVSEPEGQLRVGAVRSMPDRISSDVTEGRIRNGASPECCEGNRSPADASGVRSSHRPQSAEQRTDEPDAVRNEQRSQTVRAWRGHKTVVGRITPERYSGIIWCVRVKSGALVAVRDGFAFPTGNSGFPKSHDVSKGIDKAAGAKREVVGDGKYAARKPNGSAGVNSIGLNAEPGYSETAPATDAAREWQGWGTALKPSWEPICLARKPLIGTVAANVLEHGTGALNIDGCRIHADDAQEGRKRHGGGIVENHTSFVLPDSDHASPAGRWPANIVHDGSDEVVAAIDLYQEGAVRFFYSAKADKNDRMGSKHPTVKPVDLMQWLVRLVTPKGGLVLDPFAGSGSTGEAAWREGMRCVLIEREPEYQADIAERLRLADAGPATRRARAIKQAANDNALPLFGAADTHTHGRRHNGR